MGGNISSFNRELSHVASERRGWNKSFSTTLAGDVSKASLRYNTCYRREAHVETIVSLSHARWYQQHQLRINVICRWKRPLERRYVNFLESPMLCAIPFFSRAENLPISP